MSETTDKILLPTLELLKEFYKTSGLRVDNLQQIIFKPMRDYFYNVVIGDRSQAGKVMSFRNAIYEPELLQNLIGMSLLDVVEECINIDQSIAISALCAASRPFLTSESLLSRGINPKAKSYRDNILPHDDYVTIVGLAYDFEYLCGKVDNLHVTEMRSADILCPYSVTKDGYGFVNIGGVIHRECANEEILGQSDIVVITASSLVNDTFCDLLGYCKRAREIAVYGTSCDFIPDILFDNGVTSVEPVVMSYYHHQAAVQSGMDDRITAIIANDRHDISPVPRVVFAVPRESYRRL